MYKQSNESIRSEFTINLRRSSIEICGDAEHSPTFPNTWKHFTHLTNKQKRYTVGAFPSATLAQGTQLFSSNESAKVFYFGDCNNNNSAPLTPSFVKKVSSGIPKRNRFSSGHILGFFLKKQTVNSSKSCSERYNVKQRSEQRTSVNCDSKFQDSNFRAKPARETKGILYMKSYFFTPMYTKAVFGSGFWYFL